MVIKKKKYKFSGHQTFVLRYGWLEKGFELIIDKGKSFADEDCIVELGVGKNMVESIKYWCELTGIMENGNPSNFGRKLLHRKSGWDPFLEDLASWWLLHWKLVTNPFLQTSGTALFSFLRKPEFTKQDVAEAALRLVDIRKKTPSDSIILRDVDCYLRSYCGSQRFEKKQKSHDLSFESPLRELNLIQPMIDGGMFRFSIGRKSSLPAEIIGFAIGEYFVKENKSSMTIQRVLYKEYSPGQVFMLDENSLIEAIQELCENPKWESKFNFTESAGIAQVHCNLNQIEVYALLDDYYHRGETQDA